MDLDIPAVVQESQSDWFLYPGEWSSCKIGLQPNNLPSMLEHVVRRTLEGIKSWMRNLN